MNEQAERAKFEAWASANDFNIHRDETPKYIEYHKPTTRWAWQAWQYRATLSQAQPAAGEALTAAEALFGFMGWLTCRDEAVTFSGRHEASRAAELVSEYIDAQGLEPVRDGVYPKNLKPMGGCDDLAATPQPAQVAEPADPLDTVLPCDIAVGHVNIRKGCTLRTVVARMQVLYDMALDAANRTIHPHIVVAPQQAQGSEPAWRCFHCDAQFTGEAGAREHFGASEAQQPACLIDIAEYRSMEEANRRHCEEDTDLHREIHRLQCEHQQALRREEEKGYARGLAAQGSESGEAWYCEAHPMELMGHGGCGGAGVLDCARAGLLANQLRLAQQEAREAGRFRDDVCARAMLSRAANDQRDAALRVAIDALEILDRRPRPLCRDCADENGTCPTSGLPCDMGKCIADARAATPQPAQVAEPVRPAGEGEP